MIVLRHHRGRDQRGDARLAHRNDVRALAHHLEEADQVLDVFVETEHAGTARHVAHVVPVGDVDVVLGQHGAHGGAQQRGEMAGQRRHHQHARLRHLDVLLEMQQRAERRDVRALLAHLDLAVADHDPVDPERRPRVREAGARDQLVGRGEVADRAMLHAQDRPIVCAANPASARTGPMTSLWA